MAIDVCPAAVILTHKESTGDELFIDDLFLQAVREDSNLEMDWLWLATTVSSNAQRSYALDRALHINPWSASAKREIRQLRSRSNQPLDLS